MLSSNILLPKILLMQGLSEFVADRKAQMGDIVKSIGPVKIGDDKNPIKIIPLTYKNFWEEFEILGDSKEYRGKVERNASNENLLWEFQRDGSSWKRVQTIEVYVLLPSEIAYEIESKKKFLETGDLPDLDKTILPAVITFRSTSFKAGRGVVNHWLKIQKFPGVRAHHFEIGLCCNQDKNDKGTYFTWEVGNTKSLSPEYRAIADEWYNTLMSKPDSYKVDETDDFGTTKPQSAGNSEEMF